jgi:uncharacterized repeat protein (TIGR01451 family)
MNIKRLPMIYRYLLYLGLSFFILSLGYAAPTFNAATHDTPIDEVVTFTGTNKVVVGGISLYPTLTSNTFTVDIPACASGNPTITAAYLTWFHRSGIVSPNSGGFDPTVSLSINTGSVQSVTHNENYRASIQYSTDHVDYYHLYADITSQLQNDLIAGTNSFNVSDIDVPTPGTWLRQNYGTGATVIYTCPEYPYTKTSFFAGNDFFYCGNPYSGEYSSSYCMEFPASSNPRTINLDAIYGGQAHSSAPHRGGTYSYTTSTGNAPAMDGSTAFATGAIWNETNASANPAWSSNLGTEWDKLNATATIPANHTYMCMQSRSHQAANTAECGSLNHVAFTFSIPVDPPSTNADIEVRKAVNPVSVQSGDTATYTVEVINNGPDQATNIEVVEQLPNGVSYVAPHTASQGSYDVATGVWTVGTLANGANATLTINITAD